MTGRPTNWEVDSREMGRLLKTYTVFKRYLNYKLQNYMTESKRFTLNKADMVALGKEALKVLGPYLLVIIPVLVEQLPKDWAYAAIVIFLLQRARSLLMTFLAGSK